MRTDELAERIGVLADTAENYLAATKLPVPASLHVAGLTSGMAELARELQSLAAELRAADTTRAVP